LLAGLKGLRWVRGRAWSPVFAGRAEGPSLGSRAGPIACLRWPVMTNPHYATRPGYCLTLLPRVAPPLRRNSTPASSS